MTAIEEYVSIRRNVWPQLDEAGLKLLLDDFQQFERARATRHSRTAIETARRAGFWCGGPAPFGYRLEGRLLVPDPPADGTVRLIFDLFLRHGCSRLVVEELSRRGICRLAGGMSRPWRSTHLYAILRNSVYAGEVPLSGQSFPGHHQPLVDPVRWREVQSRLNQISGEPTSVPNALDPLPFRGRIVCGVCGRTFIHTWTRKSRTGAKYAYSLCPSRGCPAGRIPDTLLLNYADETSVEQIVVNPDHVRVILKDGREQVVSRKSPPQPTSPLRERFEQNKVLAQARAKSPRVPHR